MRDIKPITIYSGIIIHLNHPLSDDYQPARLSNAKIEGITSSGGAPNIFSSTDAGTYFLIAT